MFIHRNCGRHARAVSLGILTAAIIAAAARAAETQDPFVRVACNHRVGGAQLASGDYTSAAQALPQHSALSLPDPHTADANRCVAFAMTRQLAPAHAACDAAVHEGQVNDAAPLYCYPQTRQQAATAVACSNRAVLHFMDADLSAAQQDLARAQALAPQASFVLRNLSAMQTHQTVGTRTTATAALAAP